MASLELATFQAAHSACHSLQVAVCHTSDSPYLQDIPSFPLCLLVIFLSPVFGIKEVLVLVLVLLVLLFSLAPLLPPPFPSCSSTLKAEVVGMEKSVFKGELF